MTVANEVGFSQFVCRKLLQKPKIEGLRVNNAFANNPCAARKKSIKLKLEKNY